MTISTPPASWSPRGRAWLVTIAGSLIALAGGLFLALPTCRAASSADTAVTWPPIAWAASHGATYFAAEVLGGVWLVLWVVHARRALRQGLSPVHAMLPMLVLLWAVWRLSACV